MIMPLREMSTLPDCPWTPEVQACLRVPCLEAMTTARSHLYVHGLVSGTEDASLQPARGPLNVNLLSPQNMDQQASEQTRRRGGRTEPR